MQWLSGAHELTLKVVHHLSDIASSNVVSLIFIGSIIGCPLAGWLSDAQGRRKPLMIFGAVATLVTMVPLFSGQPLSQSLLSIIFFILGFVTSTQVISYPLIAESNAEQNIGSATGVASVIIMGGAGIAQVLFGWLIQHHAIQYQIGLGSMQFMAGTYNPPTYHLADFQYAMLMFPVAAMLALVAILLTRETECKRTPTKEY